MRSRLSVKLLLNLELLLLLLILGMIIPIRLQMRDQVIADMQTELRSVAATAALQIDGDAHRRVAERQDPGDPEFIELRDLIKRVANVNGYTRDNIYTFFEDRQAGVLRFGVMIHDEPFIGEPYQVREHQAMAAQSGEAYASDLFRDEFGSWIAAVAPIRNADGMVVGLLETARTADEYFTRVDQAILVTTVAAVAGIAIASIVGYLVLRRLVIRPVETIHEGMQALERQDFTHRTRVDTRDELQDLAATLNRMADQLNIARAIQAGFVPQEPPTTSGYSFAYRSDPCDATGGDYIDAFDLPGASAAILVADVTGHGIGPSLLMASCRSALRALAQTGLSPGPLLEKLEQQLVDDLSDGRFITMIYGVLDDDGRFTYANAGHAPALVVREGTVTRLESHRPPLGIFLEPALGDTCDLDSMQTTLQLEPGDRIVFTSDGVSETQDAQRRMFGMNPIESIATREDLDPAAVVRMLADQLVLHRGSTPQADDITILCADRAPV